MILKNTGWPMKIEGRRTPKSKGGSFAKRKLQGFDTSIPENMRNGSSQIIYLWYQDKKLRRRVEDSTCLLVRDNL